MFRRLFHHAGSRCDSLFAPPASRRPDRRRRDPAVAQTKMLPFDHIHLNEPAAEASQWWEKNIPGGRRITEAPNRIMYGAVRLMFLSPRRPAAATAA